MGVDEGNLLVTCFVRTVHAYKASSSYGVEIK